MVVLQVVVALHGLGLLSALCIIRIDKLEPLGEGWRSVPWFRSLRLLHGACGTYLQLCTIKCYFGDLSQAKTKGTCLLPLVLSGEKLKKPPIYLFAYLDLSL